MVTVSSESQIATERLVFTGVNDRPGVDPEGRVHYGVLAGGRR